MKTHGAKIRTLWHHGHSARSKQLPDGRWTAVVFRNQLLHRNAEDGVNGRTLIGSWATEEEAFDAAKAIMEFGTD